MPKTQSGGAKKTLFHSELVQLGPIEVVIKSDVMQSKYQGKSDYVIMEIDGVTRTYNVENDGCADALGGMEGQTVIIEAIGSRDEAEIIVSEPTGGGNGGGRDNRRTDDRRREEPRSERGGDRGSDRRDERREAPRHEERQERRETQRQEPQKPATQQQQRRYQPLGVTVGMAINNACQFLIASGEKLDPKRITEISSDILRVARWLELGNLMPKPGEPKAPPVTQQQKPADKLKSESDQTAGQTKNAEAPQPGPHEPPPDDDVPF